MKFDFSELLESIKEAKQIQEVSKMCDCKCKCAEVKAERKSARYYDILVEPWGDYVYDIPESQLSERINELLEDGLRIEDLRITEEISVKQVWVIDK